MKIGLTGGIASGKSTVSKLLRDLGACIIDADKINHRLMKRENKLWEGIVKEFGEDILLEDREINRKKLGNIIFNNPQEKRRLEEISHPIIINEIKEKMNKLEEKEEIIIADIPLLIETGMMDLFDQIWLVYVNKEVQLERLMQRDKIDEETALKKINSQLSLDEKREYADRIIENNGSEEELEEKVQNLINE